MENLPYVLWLYQNTAQTSKGETTYNFIYERVFSERVAIYDRDDNQEELRTNFDLLEKK